MVTWSFTRDPAAFLDEAGPVLAADPLVATVVATTAERHAAGARVPGWEPPEALRWFAVARDVAGRPVAAAMRTHPTPPHALFVLPCDAAAATVLARTLHERGEEVPAVNGALPAARVVAEETARLAGGRVVEQVATRIFEATDVVLPPAPPGRLRRATPADADVCATWLDRFDDEAEEQAGRVPGGGSPHVDASRVPERIAEGTLWLWERPDGTPVQLCLVEPPAYGLARVALVYTPPEHRGHRYAARAVAELSQRALAAGHRVCLFADRDNPTSNRVYGWIGFRAVHDCADLVVVPA